MYFTTTVPIIVYICKGFFLYQINTLTNRVVFCFMELYTCDTIVTFSKRKFMGFGMLCFDSCMTGLRDRLKNGGDIVIAEGYLLELERRGYLQAGAFIPEVVLEHPEVVKALHEEFVHAGSDVVVAFTVRLKLYGLK